jgi:hypothetical protein
MSSKNAEQHLKTLLFNDRVRRHAKDNPGMPVGEAVKKAEEFATEKTPELYRAIEKCKNENLAGHNKGP